MRKTIELKDSSFEGKTLVFKVDGAIALSTLTPTGQMIVDSDQSSFVYLAENEEEYVYLYIKAADWPNLKRALDQKASVYAVRDEEELGLANILEELEYLIENIEGNSNYGEELVASVETTFLK